jgi:uncharacterized protein (DUF2384 family)
MMAKKAKPKKYTSTDKTSKVNEPVELYRTVKRLPTIADFPFSKFEKIATRVPFSLSEWANILHLSERTLQRYTKNKSSFEGIYTDRILHIEQLINLGLETFGNADAFYEWLHKEKKVLGYTLNFQSLYSMQGIQYIIDQIERIQQGVYT